MTFILIGYFDRDTLFCSSRDLQESVEDPTTFCTVQGVFLCYTVEQVLINAYSSLYRRSGNFRS